MTVIVAGSVWVEPATRDQYVDAHQVIVRAARVHPGCLDLAISPDPIDPGRVNIYEYWDSQQTLDTWRTICPRPNPTTASIISQNVQLHEISSSGPPFRAKS
ncbi:antibiotic biosynthesis monooxygenase [Kribbella sp. NBC_01505]|uniref:putative quinol monooxygenase n=1 Tax=Kribbella sp. NBC_01505 TaxID=2903580 RepID=UPI00386DF2E6